MNLPNPSPVLDLIEAFRRSKTMFTAASLGIFDRLAAGPSAARSETEARLLDACVALGLLARNGDEYENTPLASAYLTRDSPNTLTGYILYSDRVLYQMWSHLDDAIREGTHRWKQTFDLDGPIFAHFFRTDEAKREFLLGMHGLGLISSPAVVSAFDLSRFHRLVDLGGGTGHLALAAAARCPEMQVGLFDLPSAIDYAREFTAGSNVELIGGDFFADPLPPADIYALGRILHDWSEEKIRILLARMYSALPPGGAVLIAEKLLEEGLGGPAAAHMQSLNMLICTEGRERSFSQYADLLQEAGFSQMKGHVTGTPLDAVLALK